MGLSDNKRWPPFIDFTGKKHALKHVHPFQAEIIQAAAKGKPEKRYDCWVTFNSHCFTRRRPLVELSTSARVYRDPMGENRIFCEDRYGLSLALPGILTGAFHNQVNCYQTKSDRFLLVKTVNHEGKVVYYEIYFKIFKARRKNTVNIEVVSAYPRNLDSNKTPVRFPKMRIQIMAFKVINEKPLTMAPGRSRKR